MKLQHVSVSAPAGGREEARRFYGGLLGLEEREVPPKLDPDEFVWFRAGGDLELHVMLRGGPEHDDRHFCLVVDELEEVRGRIEAAGVETFEPTPIAGRPRFMCRDPFGNLVELTRIEGA